MQVDIQPKPPAFQIRQATIPFTVNRGMLFDVTRALLATSDEEIIRLAFFLGEFFNHRQRHDPVLGPPFSITNITLTGLTITVNIDLLESLSLLLIPARNKAVAALGYQLGKQHNNFYQPTSRNIDNDDERYDGDVD